MRELKILAVLIVVIGVVYWGVEPLAHSVMHPSAAPADYQFKDLNPINLDQGDAKKGKELVATNCASCHGVEKDGVQAPMDAASAAGAFGVAVPDLSFAGGVFDPQYLAHFILDPVGTAHLSHKFKVTCEGLSGDEAKKCEEDNQGKADYPMSAFKGILSEADVADIVAYFKSIAPEKLSDKEVFAQACERCHSVKYDKVSAATPDENLSAYLGTAAPDLSMMIRAKGEHYLNIFINDPQKELKGTAMPRVGVSEAAQEQIVKYLQNVGDSKKAERDSLGIKIMAFFVLLSILAYAWKRRIWSDLH